jgi:hypothetical protein
MTTTRPPEFKHSEFKAIHHRGTEVQKVRVERKGHDLREASRDRPLSIFLLSADLFRRGHTGKLVALMQGRQIISWTATGRTLVFVLSAMSIVCLLVEFYRFCPMREFTIWVFFPSCVALLALAILSKVKGDGRLWRAVMIGLFAGLLAAVAYDIFRLPFVFAKQWGLSGIVPPMNLYKVFPRFGAMILGEPIEQTTYSLQAQLVGWFYHFSNGATFGAMFMAMVGTVTKRNWVWAVLMAAGIEAGMLFTPYPSFFGIPLTAAFVIVTLTAHLIFGAVIGLSSLRWSSSFSLSPAPTR